jgi:hypothetical protein
MYLQVLRAFILRIEKYYYDWLAGWFGFGSVRLVGWLVGMVLGAVFFYFILAKLAHL